LGLFGTLGVIGFLASAWVPALQAGPILCAWALGLYVFLWWGRRQVGPIATTPNTRHEPLLYLFFICFALIFLAMQTALFGPHRLAAPCSAGAAMILTLFGLRTWSMNYAAFDGRLPKRFQFDPEREARWMNFGRPVRPAEGDEPPKGP